MLLDSGNDTLYVPCTLPLQCGSIIQSTLITEDKSFEPVQTNYKLPHGRAPLKVTMGRQRREQKVGWRGWIWPEVWDFLSFQSVELSGL